MHTNLTAIQDALVTAIAAQTGCRVSLGYPLKGTLSEDVWVGIDARMSVTDEMTGYCERTESAEVPVFVWVEKTGGTPKATRDRAFALMEDIEDALAADRTLGGICESASVSGFETDYSYTEKSVQVGIAVRIAVESTVV